MKEVEKIGFPFFYDNTARERNKDYFAILSIKTYILFGRAIITSLTRVSVVVVCSIVVFSSQFFKGRFMLKGNDIK